MSNLALVTDNMLPVANETFIDNLSAGISAGAAIVPINSLAEYADGDSVVLTVDPGTASQATFIGEKQGNTVIDCKWTEGNVGASHSAGATVIDYDSATHYNVITKLLRATHNENATLKTTAVQAALNISSAVPADYTALAQTATTVIANGNRSYSMTFPGVNYTDRLSPGMRLRTVRQTPAPNQCALFDGVNDYFNDATVAGMTFTDDFVVSAWVKLNAYPTSTTASIVARFNGTSGFRMEVNLTGQIGFYGINSGAGNFSGVQTKHAIPLGKWVHITAQLDMSAFTATPTTSYVMFDGIDMPCTVARAGTNPTALIQAGELQIGASNGTLFFNGKLAQVAIFNNKITQSTVRNQLSQGLAGTETSLISAYSLSNTLNDLNVTNANNLTANGGVLTTVADSPFGIQANGTNSATVDYGIIQQVTYSAPDTTVIVQAPEGGTVPTAGGVNSVSYSQFKTPYQFPAQSDRWKIRAIMFSQESGGPGANVYANIGQFQLVVPIGAWTLKYASTVQATISANNDLNATLSTTTNSETNKPFTANGIIQGSGQTASGLAATRSDDVQLSTATTFYHLIRSLVGGTIYFRGDSAAATIEADNGLL